MTKQQMSAAQACLAGAEANTMSFPEIVACLMAAGFESYGVDFRRSTATYFLPDGESLQLSAHPVDGPVAPVFNSAGLQAAIREAQLQVPGYSYKGFCRKAAAAGSAGYIVSFSGRRALYFGRTAETHVELFPQTASS